EPAPGGIDREPAPGGIDREPAPGGIDREPAPGGIDRGPPPPSIPIFFNPKIRYTRSAANVPISSFHPSPWT
ncbi:MAG: hypothetical protein AB8I56_15985, partial [Anaerolineales bacterium]